MTAPLALRRPLPLLLPLLLLPLLLAACATYEAKPLSFRAPDAYPNHQLEDGVSVGAEVISDAEQVKAAFGYDVIAAGLLPVRVVLENKSGHTIRILSDTTLLQDREGNLWPLLDMESALERATKYAHTKGIFQEAAYKGFLGAMAGAVVGAAVGVVGNDDVAQAAAKGAAVGAAAGAVLGGGGAYVSDDQRARIMEDLTRKALQLRRIKSNTLAHGLLLFPAEAKAADNLRLAIGNAQGEGERQFQLRLQ